MKRRIHQNANDERRDRQDVFECADDFVEHPVLDYLSPDEVQFILAKTVFLQHGLDQRPDSRLRFAIQVRCSIQPNQHDLSGAPRCDQTTGDEVASDQSANFFSRRACRLVFVWSCRRFLRPEFRQLTIALEEAWDLALAQFFPHGQLSDSADRRIESCGVQAGQVDERDDALDLGQPFDFVGCRSKRVERSRLEQRIAFISCDVDQVVGAAAERFGTLAIFVVLRLVGHQPAHDGNSQRNAREGVASGGSDDRDYE